jgi:hypothetical protein
LKGKKVFTSYGEAANNKNSDYIGKTPHLAQISIIVPQWTKSELSPQSSTVETRGKIPVYYESIKRELNDDTAE